jgi:hypothetical protein
VVSGGLTILAKGLKNWLFAAHDPFAVALESWRKTQAQQQ